MENLSERKTKTKKIIRCGLSKDLNEGLRKLYDKFGIPYDDLVLDTDDEIVEIEDNDYKET